MIISRMVSPISKLLLVFHLFIYILDECMLLYVSDSNLCLRW